MKIVVIDGQGGNIGRMLIERLIKKLPDAQIVAVGTNGIATANMLKAGVRLGATGENATIVNARDADYIIGPIGIVIADSLLGEVTPAMAAAVGGSPAKKVLIPSLKCNNYVVGTKEIALDRLIELAAEEITEV
ncbi:MAG TPA: DUF3842 family protein [Lachnospiraceae bacterium]|nr:DUF3842 family protein [Lachnospiraceae bacterium]